MSFNTFAERERANVVAKTWSMQPPRWLLQTRCMATDLCLACGESAIKKDRRLLGGSGNTSEQVTAKTSRSNIPAIHDLQLFWLDSSCSKLPGCFRRYSLKLGHG